MKATDSSNANEPNLSETDNLTPDGLLDRLMQGSEPEAPELPESPEEEVVAEAIEEVEDFEPEVAEEPTEEVEEEPESIEEEVEAEEEGEIDLMALSVEEIQDLAKRGKSRLLDRVAQLTAKNKALESQFDELKDKQPFKREIPQDQNPFKDLASLEEVKDKWAEVEQTLEHTDALLDEYEDYSSDDVITVGDKEFTKKQIKDANRKSREALNKFLPAQADHLRKSEGYKKTEEHWNQQAAKEVPEIKDEESTIGKQYAQVMESPGIAKLKQIAPEFAVDVSYIMAHALRSIHGQAKPKVPKGAGTKLKVKPPASPVGAGTAPGGAKPSSRSSDLMAEANERGGMSQDDLVAYLTSQTQ